MLQYKLVVADEGAAHCNAHEVPKFSKRTTLDDDPFRLDQIKILLLHEVRHAPVKGDEVRVAKGQAIARNWWLRGGRSGGDAGGCGGRNGGAGGGRGGSNAGAGG